MAGESWEICCSSHQWTPHFATEGGGVNSSFEGPRAAIHRPGQPGKIHLALGIGHWPFTFGEMAEEIAVAPPSEAVHQFSVFVPNRMGRMLQIVHLLAERHVHIMALSVLDTTDSTILRFLVDDPGRARALLDEHTLPFTENPVVCVEFDYEHQLQEILAALLEAELNLHFIYPFLIRPGGKPALVMSLEFPEVAEESLRRHQFRVLYQADISR